MSDQHLICIDCHEAFVLSKDEEAFFTGRGLAIPKRCARCRRARKHEKASRRPPYGPPHEARSQSPASPRRPKYPVRCSDCGAEAEVPFRPREGRPVFCANCYRARKGAEQHATEGAELGNEDKGIIE